MRIRARAALVAFSLIALASCREWDAPPAVAEDQAAQPVAVAAITSLADCEALVSTGNGVSGTELYRYTDCRFDRLEELLGADPEEPTPSATSSPSSSPTSSPSASIPPAPGATGFPTAATAGVPAGWTPASTRSGFTVTTAGAVVENVRVNGDLIIDAANVTVRNVEVFGGRIENYRGNTCRNGLVVENTTIRRGTAATTDNGNGALGSGGYTARNVKIDGLPEGFRVGGRPGCGPVSISDSWANVVSPDQCNDWHGDGLQGYGGNALVIRNSVLILDERSGCGGTAPFFYPANQGNTSATVDGLIVQGGGFPFRLTTAGSVTGLKIVDGSWGYGPKETNCALLTTWAAQIVTLDANGQPVRLRDLPC